MVVEPSSLVARIGDRTSGSRFAVDRSGHGHHAGRRIDGELSARVVVQRVGDAVGRRVAVAGQRRDAHRRAHRRVLVHRIGRRVAVADGRDVEFVQVVDRDRIALRGRGTVVAGGADVIERVAPASRSMAPATVTTPVDGSMANCPPASSSSEYVMPLVVASPSLARAVMPTAVPNAAFSSTASAAASLSVIGVMSNSSRSLIAIV